MKVNIIGFVVALGCAASLAAQGTTETKSKVTIKDGKSMTVTGCVTATNMGTGFMLTNVADKRGAVSDYMLVANGTDLRKHVGHRVELTGDVTDRGNAKVMVETKEKTKVEHGDDKETRTKAELTGDLDGAYMGVKSLKMIAAVCP